MNNLHQLLFLFLTLTLTIVACKSVDGLTKKERKELAILERERFVADSTAAVRRMEAMIKARELARLDSIHVADSIAALPPPIDYDTVLVASLLRTPCFGKCPNYEIRLYASGYATYEGLRFVDSLGRFEARVDKALVKAVRQQANAINYFSLADRYPTEGRGIEDFPLCVTYFREENIRKFVYNRNDAPRNLVQYEKFFDGLFQQVDWKKIGESR
jgi:hypothetical protein